MSVPTITPRGLEALRLSGRPIDLIDVRTPVEFREAHVTFARNVPIDRLDPAAILRDRTALAGDPLYVICRSGNRGQKACEMLIAASVPNVVNVEGGTLAWTDAGLPVVRGKKAMSLGRQVRIAAGSLVLLGALLAWFLDPAFVALSAFIGAGLVSSGVSDTCGMGLFLARMPWNRVKDAPPEYCAPKEGCS
jgi:rhodanese-related sulfurtransferase